MKKAFIISLGLSLGIVSAYGQERTPPTSAELIEKMDTDKDGKLSESEVKGPLAKEFATIDTDENGLLTLEELDAFTPTSSRKGRKR